MPLRDFRWFGLQGPADLESICNKVPSMQKFEFLFCAVVLLPIGD
jgi:hypothetical protein